MNKLDVLKQNFGFDDFLPHQDGIIDSILENKDVCVVMPTGAGKSLCYQLPILMKRGYSIVVSPLISLMKDQVDTLNSKNIPSAYINSTMTHIEQQKVISSVAMGNIKMLYIAPERIGMQSFKSLVFNQPPDMLVVDEAHCISQWGHDFRPAYFRLGDFVSEMNIPQVCAFTATATPEVRDDIKKYLNSEDMEIVVTGFKRPNLRFSVKKTPKDEEKNKELEKILKTPKPTIIYVSTRKKVDTIKKLFNCIPYHAGLSDKERSDAQNKFMSDKCPVLVATNAFGMGIDRPDIRRVIHYNIPGTLEAYYQEAGRAGRDGEMADCILLFSNGDQYVQKLFVDMSNPTKDLLMITYLTLLKLVEETGNDVLEMTLEDIAEKQGMKSEQAMSGVMGILERHGYIKRSFQSSNKGVLELVGDLESLKKEHIQEKTQRSRFISRCINYFKTANIATLDCSYTFLAEVAGLKVEQIKRVLKAIPKENFNWDPPFRGRITTILRKEEKITDIDFKILEEKHKFEMDRLGKMIYYGHSKKCRQLFLISYFGENEKDYRCGLCDFCTGKIDQPQFKTYNNFENKGQSFNYDNKYEYKSELLKSHINNSKKDIDQPKQKVKTTPIFADDDLYERLRELRKQLADEQDIPVYMIFSNETLKLLADKTPLTKIEAMKLKGIGRVKASTVLPEFLKEIRSWRSSQTFKIF